MPIIISFLFFFFPVGWIFNSFFGGLTFCKSSWTLPVPPSFQIKISLLFSCLDSVSEPYVSTATSAVASAGPTGSERKKSAPAIPPIVTQQPPSAEASSDEEEGEEEEEDDEDENDAIGTGVDLSAAQSSSSAQRSRSQSIQMANKAKFGSKGALHSPVGSAHSFDLQVRF